MKTKFTLLFLLFAFFNFTGTSQAVWTGPKMTFTKASNADWTLAQNQDRITSNVWLTRKNTRGLYNIVTETSYVTNVSPADTEWAFGTTANIGSLTFDDWRTITRNNPNGDHENLSGQDMVLHLITDDIYIDLKYLSWGVDDGGSLSYERSTDQALGIDDLESLNAIKVHPNPTSDFIYIDNLNGNNKVLVYDMLGKLVLSPTLSDNKSIDIRKLEKGMYFLKIQNNFVRRIIKN